MTFVPISSFRFAAPRRGWATLGTGTADRANHASRLRPFWPPPVLGLRKGTDVASATLALPSALRTGAQFRGWVARSATADPDTVEDLRFPRRRSAPATQPPSRRVHRHLRRPIPLDQPGGPRHPCRSTSRKGPRLPTAGHRSVGDRAAGSGRIRSNHSCGPRTGHPNRPCSRTNCARPEPRMCRRPWPRRSHSVATVPGPSCVSATKRLLGSHTVILPSESMPGPKLDVVLPPTFSSTVVGTNHDEIPGPVAIARHTSSGVPGTSTWTSTLRRPDGSFLMGKVCPFTATLCVEGGTQSAAGGRVRPVSLHRGSG